MHGAWLLARASDGHSTLVGVVLWTLSIYSLAGHKEWRFLHPLLPLLHICATKSLVDLYAPQHLSFRDGEDGTQHPTRKQDKITNSPLLLLPRLFIVLHLLLFVCPGIYLALFHGRAQIALVYRIHDLPRSPDPDAPQSLGFLMPCHSIPWQAYIHRADLADPKRMWALGCEPPLA